MTVTTPAQPTTWIDACAPAGLRVEDGVAVLLPDGRQVAVFRTRDQHLYAVDNIDPYTGAAVISRGIVGDRAGEPTVASPMLKNVFSLRTGQSLDDEHVRLTTWPVRQTDTAVQIGAPAQEGTP
ncbi:MULTISPECIES: nitrite reductase small subunit NirD [Nocardiopsis]|uniref:Nitrite reductase small subunit NirD n=1 Tax=Nocardiopsis akebiae TaxID=2831968 RepID=A0ABX8BX55_9ACTN|nr:MULTISPECIES: nitrite reductase small subunit NirD [Nocardiopsis]QUX26649.1 nitrite reductase small subunit NirD [Nocardiopsis akebiae]WDZ88357.1 nitrite reductase small subunit NirD [Nocardiopsis sp. HUAS JQ3]